MPCSCHISCREASSCVHMTSYSTPWPTQHERTPKTDQRIPNYGHCSASTRGGCMRMSELEVTILDLQRAPYRREACCRVVQGIKTTVNSISVGRFDQNLAVQRISPSQQPNWMCMPIQHHIAIWRPTSTKGALFLHVHPPSIAHTRCVKGPSVCANHTATAVKPAIASSLYVATGCTGVMSVCANQSSLSRHNFGGCLAKTSNKGGISNSHYTRFERTYLIGCPSSNAGVVSPDVP